MTLEQIVALLKQVTDAVRSLEDASKENTKSLEDDVQLIALAKQYPIKNHVLCRKTDAERKLYIGSLLAFTNNNADKGFYQKQRLFLCRIVASYDDHINFKDYVAQSMKINMKQLIDLSEVLDLETRICYAVDLLILNMLNVIEIGKSGYEAMADILQFLKLDKASVVKVINIAKALVEQKIDRLLNLIEISDDINYSNFLGYYSECKYTSIVSNLTDINDIHGNVLVVNMQISNYKDFFELSKYVVEKITFYNCSFTNIRGFRGNKQPVIFEHCKFENNYFESNERRSLFGTYNEYEKDYVFIQGNKLVFKNTVFAHISTSKHILDVKDLEIENCRFVNCKGIELPCSFMFQINNGKVSNSIFENCVMETDRSNRSTTSGGILFITNGDLEGCNFKNCTSKGVSGYGRFAKFQMQIVRAINSKVEKNHFNNCNCSSDNSSDKDVTSYILGIKNSSDKDNKFTECSSYHYHYSDILSNHNVGQIG